MPRTKGAINKKTKQITDLLAETYPDWNPILQMAQLAQGDLGCSNCNGKGKLTQRKVCPICQGTGKLIVSQDIKLAAAKEVAQYIAPKRKAIEHSGNVGTRVKVIDLSGNKS